MKTLTVDPGAVSIAKALLEAVGYKVIIPRDDMETPAELGKRLHILPSTLCMRLKHPKCPPFDCIRANGGKGRLLYIEAHEPLETFLKAHGKPRGRNL